MKVMMPLAHTSSITASLNVGASKAAFESKVCDLQVEYVVHILMPLSG